MDNWEQTFVQGPTGSIAATSVSPFAQDFPPERQRSSSPSLPFPTFTIEEDSKTPTTGSGSDSSPRLPQMAEASSQTAVPAGRLNQSEAELARELQRSRIHFANFELDTGDTLVFIDCPECPRDYRGQADCHGIPYQSQQLRVDSKKLLASGSFKFAEMLNPTYQFRIKRRRHMVNNMPEGIEFLLDLTPPNEGDDLVFQMTELSLTPGIIKWWTSSSIHKIDRVLVTGHDDVCYCSMITGEPWQAPRTPYQLEKSDTPADRKKKKWHTESDKGPDSDPQNTMTGILSEGARINPFKLVQMKVDGENDLYEIPAYRNIPEYCPFRHRNSIIRLLLLIEGKHVMLDSATKLWTLCGVARIFDCAPLVRDEVAQWIMHGNNVRFIEVLPEEALQLGYTLQIPQVTQCAFRILVNEMALEEAATPGGHAKANHVTVFGRRRGDLGDELNNLVQHAARALVERITLQLTQLRNPLFLDYSDLPEWIKLCRLEQKLLLEKSKFEAAVALKKLRLLMTALRDLIPDILNTVEKSKAVYSPALHNGMDFDRATYVEPKDFSTMRDTVQGFNSVQMLLCSLVYHQITEEVENAFRFERLFDKVPSAFFKHVDSLLTATELALQRFMDAYPRVVEGAEWANLLNLGSMQATKLTVKVPSISVLTFGNGLKTALQPFLSSWIRHDIDPALNITRHLLLTLNNDEMKFLPLWAGGCNDGTGGVFETLVPPADLGPNGPGPAYHTGITIPSAPSSSSGTLLEDFQTMNIMGSTTAGSVDVHDSISTVYRPDQIIADDVSIASEMFTATGSDFQDARFAIPASGQRTGQALEMICDLSTDDDIKSFSTDTDSQMTGSIVEKPNGKDGAAEEEEDDDDDVSFIWDEDNMSEGDDMDFI